mmetsp:Transcript_26219/g.47280  ORF Transcript_26219/g.47280 Transcript_26219/m.47280 type:complete len:91 (+) Transcript_26219:31-303(+)
MIQVHCEAHARHIMHHPSAFLDPDSLSISCPKAVPGSTNAGAMTIKCKSPWVQLRQILSTGCSLEDKSKADPKIQQHRTLAYCRKENYCH